MISFDEFLKQDDEEKYNNMQCDMFQIQALKDELENRDIYISKLEVAYSKEIERLKEDNEYLNKVNIELSTEKNRLNNIINELEKDFERKIQSCTIEAETTTNDFYCRLHIATLTKWLNKIKELKGSNEPSFEEMVGFVKNVYKDIKSQSTLHEELEEERKTIAKIVGDFKEVNK